MIQYFRHIISGRISHGHDNLPSHPSSSYPLPRLHIFNEKLLSIQINSTFTLFLRCFFPCRSPWISFKFLQFLFEIKYQIRRLWLETKQLPSLRFDNFFKNSLFSLKHVNIYYKTKQLLSNFLSHFPKFR